MFEENSVQDLEYRLVGMLIQKADLYLHVTGILSEKDFVCDETRALYQAFKPEIWKPGQSIMRSIPLELVPSLEKVRDTSNLETATDGATRVKTVVKLAIELKRKGLAKANEELASRIQDTEDETELRRLQQ